MEELLALQNEDIENKKRFKETMSLRDRILTLKDEIEDMEMKIKRVEDKNNSRTLELIQMKTEIKMQENQLKELDGHIKKRLQLILNLENQLKNSRESFCNLLREHNGKCTNYLARNKNIVKTSSACSDSQNEAIKYEIWKKQGEIEALKIIEKYQASKLKEIFHITELVQPFIKELEALEE